MQVQGIQNNYNNNYKPAFKSAIIEKSAEKVIDSLSVAEQKEFNNIIQRISNTKFWDMRLSKVIRNTDDFWCDFVNKKNPKKVFKLGIQPFEANGSKVKIQSIITQDDGIVEKIRFSSPQRVQAMLDMYKRHAQEMTERNFNSSNLQRFARWAEQLEFLDEAYRYMKLGEVYPFEGTQNITARKPSIINKISDLFGWG